LRHKDQIKISRNVQDLRPSQCCCWRYNSSGMWHCVVECVLPDFQKVNSVLTFRVKHFKNNLGAEDEDTTILQNDGSYSHNITASHLRRWDCTFVCQEMHCVFHYRCGHKWIQQIVLLSPLLRCHMLIHACVTDIVIIQQTQLRYGGDLKCSTVDHDKPATKESFCSILCLSMYKIKNLFQLLNA